MSRFCRTLLVLLLAAGTLSAYDANALVVLDVANYGQTLQAEQAIEYHSAHVRHVFPNRVFICYLPLNKDSYVEELGFVKGVHRGPVDVALYPELTQEEKWGIAAWNHLKGQVPPLPDSLVLGFEIEPSKSPQIQALEDTSMAWPSSVVGKKDVMTSLYMIGSTTISLLFVESTGSQEPESEDWNVGSAVSAIKGVVGGLEWLSTVGDDWYADLSWVYDIHYVVPTGLEPIRHPAGRGDKQFEEIDSTASAYITTNYIDTTDSDNLDFVVHLTLGGTPFPPLFYYSRGTWDMNVFRVDTNGANLLQLTSDGGVYPAPSPVESLVVYTKYEQSGSCARWTLMGTTRGLSSRRKKMLRYMIALSFVGAVTATSP